MSNTTGNTARHDDVVRRTWNETKSALKTTEFYAWIVVSLAILIASAVVDNADEGHTGFGADQAWLYVALVTMAYILSRGIAKAGVRKPEHDDDDRRDGNGRSN
ncbi:hypothetical protein [Curtobacterium sp. MCBD17_032]|uniref:hypothetical protein n=1 Tax=Curtobacterium sp. MCBD17_032 TaxID=2175659 RepID=UPI000DA8BEBB|nr:hypothetical protein [Curtobacterium sp. MCBD17_032]PZE86932.1 hypothetical protein DEI91_01120 [Curtobacterium sp. MCBD17_032]